MNFPIVLYQNKKDATPKRREGSWETFIDFILNYVEGSPCSLADCIGKDCRWKSSSMHPGNPMAWSPANVTRRRANENVSSISLLVLDFDHLTPDAAASIHAALASYEHVWHTTHSHREHDACLRAVLALSRLVPAAEWREFLSAAVRFLAVPADPTCKDLSRLYYRPSHPHDAPHAAGHVKGNVLDVDAVLAWGRANPAPAPEPKAEAPLLDRGERDESDWDLDGEHVRLAIATIAANMPAKRRHELALALGGMLFNHEATIETARYILHEGFAEGGSQDPETRSNTVDHTWDLGEDAAMTGFTTVCEILGEEVARDLGDLFTAANNATMTRNLLGRARSTAPTDDIVADLVVDEAPKTEELIAIIKATRRKKRRRAKGKDRLHAELLDRIVSGRPLVTFDEIEVGYTVDSLIKPIAGVLSWVLPVTTPPEAVGQLAQTSLALVPRASGTDIVKWRKELCSAFALALARGLARLHERRESRGC